MGLTAFKYHIRLLFESNGQSLNSETLSDMYNRYREIVERLRRNSNEIKNGPFQGDIFVTIGVLT